MNTDPKGRLFKVFNYVLAYRHLYKEEGSSLNSHKMTEITKKAEDIIKTLKKHANPEAVEAMKRFGIKAEHALGVSIHELRRTAKSLGKNHGLALQLWESGIHDARLLASLVDEPARVTEKQIEAWVMNINSWDLCDLCCSNLFDKTPYACKKCFEWSSMQGEFVKRAGFVMMACLAVHDKEAPDSEFLQFLPVIKREANDERNFVRKAVNWALRQIGKRNTGLNRAAIKAAEDIKRLDSKAASWIASDALRELKSEAVQRRLRDRRGVGFY